MNAHQPLLDESPDTILAAISHDLQSAPETGKGVSRMVGGQHVGTHTISYIKSYLRVKATSMSIPLSPSTQESTTMHAKRLNQVPRVTSHCSSNFHNSCLAHFLTSSSYPLTTAELNLRFQLRRQFRCSSMSLMPISRRSAWLIAPPSKAFVCSEVLIQSESC